MIARHRTYALLLAFFTVLADQVSKRWASAGLPPRGGHLALPGPVDLTLSLNPSNAFGLAPIIGHATRWLLMGANLAVAAVILYVILAKSVRPLLGYGLALVMAGAIGNALDRALIGAAVDFFDASKIGFVWIFNVADAAIDAGVALILFSFWTEQRRAVP